MTRLPRPSTARLRGWTITIAALGGFWRIVGDQAEGWHDWRGGIALLLVVLGLTEALVGLRSVREEWSWKAAGEAAVGASMVVLALILSDSWRWIAAGAWTVGVIVVMKIAWPAPQEASA